MGLLRKGIAALLAVCVTVTSMGFGVQAQEFTQNEQETVQESVEHEENRAEETDTEGNHETKVKSVENAAAETDSKENAAAETDSEENTAVETDSEENAAAETDIRDVEEDSSHKSGILNFIMLESAYIQTPGVQNVAVSLGEENAVLERAELIYRNVTANREFAAEAAMLADNMVKFAIEYTDDSQTGVYSLVSIRYQTAGREYEVVLSDLGMDVRFGVNQEVDAKPDEVLVDEDVLEEVEANVVTMDGNGNVVSEQNIADVLQDAQATGRAADQGKAYPSAAKKMVIVLDPGHDNSHTGASYYGYKEQELVLKIAQYCKTELQKYSGVTVYMTRTSNDCPNGGWQVKSSDCNAKRVEFAAAKKADVYVSLHLNASTDTSVGGVGVYYPNGSYRPDLGAEGAGLATEIYRKLSALGLRTWAGGILIHNSEDNTRYPDGSLADYLGVIRRSKLAGIPAVLVEHAFLSNAADVAGFLNSDDKLKRLGVADAQGIAQYYGLSMKGSEPVLEPIQSRGSKKLRIRWEGTADAVSYQIYRSSSEKGTYKKVGESKTCSYVDKTVKPGSGYYYKVRAVLSNGKKSSYSKVKYAMPIVAPAITGIVSKSGGKLDISWKSVKKAVAYEVWRSEENKGTYTLVATATANSYEDKNIATQKTYYYKVRAKGATQDSYSSYCQIRSGWAIEKPVIRSVSSENSASLCIKWNKVKNASAYRVRRSTEENGTYKTIATVKSGKTSYVDSGLKVKTRYYYKVEAANLVNGKEGCSGYSSSMGGETITPTSMVYARSIDSSTMELKWKKDDNAYAYSIKRSTKKKGTYVKIAEIRDSKITEYQDKGVVGGTQYYYVVETIIDKQGVKGYSGNSKPVSAVSLKKVEITSIQRVDKGLLLNWESVPGANCYEVLRSTRKSGGFTEIAKVRGTEAIGFTDQGVTKGMKYYYRVRAVREGKYTGYGSYGKVAESVTY